MRVAQLEFLERLPLLLELSHANEVAEVDQEAQDPGDREESFKFALKPYSVAVVDEVVLAFVCQGRQIFSPVQVGIEHDVLLQVLDARSLLDFEEVVLLDFLSEFFVELFSIEFLQQGLHFVGFLFLFFFDFQSRGFEVNEVQGARVALRLSSEAAVHLPSAVET